MRDSGESEREAERKGIKGSKAMSKGEGLEKRKRTGCSYQLCNLELGT